MSDAESARAIRAQMRRARALQEHINLLGAGLPDPCADLLAAARAVEQSAGMKPTSAYYVEVPWRLVLALRAAIEAASNA